jgi:hypothetical protein
MRVLSAEIILTACCLIGSSMGIKAQQEVKSSISKGVVCVETDDAIQVSVAGKPVLTYNKATLTGPVGTESYYARSGHIHPIYNPAGQVVSGDFPSDHLHQHALFFAWTKCEFEGHPVEFWNQKLELGRVQHDKVLSVDSGETEGGFSVQMLYLDTKNEDHPKPVLRETWTVRVYNDSKDSFRFDITSKHECASDSPLKIEEYHYGGMAIRGSNEWIDTDLGSRIQALEKAAREHPDKTLPSLYRHYDYLTSDGNAWKEGNHSRPNWVSLHGKLGGKPTGIAVLSHSDNFRSPQPVRLHPSMPYFCYAPMFLGEFEIAPGKPYVSTYRYVVHLGAPDAAKLDKEWRRFNDER